MLWRTTKNPYRILLSEVMAQQTQVNRVALFYPAWLKKFPTLSRLAGAAKADVLRQWSGLGYNNRALRLHELAKHLTENSRGRLPQTIEELQDLPGIGKYTAHAVACFAFGAAVAVVDVNVRRIFSRVFWNACSAADLKPDGHLPRKLYPGKMPRNGTRHSWTLAHLSVRRETRNAARVRSIRCARQLFQTPSA